MIKLKELLKESYVWDRKFGEPLPTLEDAIRQHQMINESTRWNVGIENPNGKVLATYGHFDGYVKGVGRTLKKHYTNAGKVKQLIKLGKQGISVLDKDIKGAKGHSFNSPVSGQTIFYGRDRGEGGSMSDTYKDRDAYASGFDQEYAYLYNIKEKKWYIYAKYGDKSWNLL